MGINVRFDVVGIENDQMVGAQPGPGQSEQIGMFEEDYLVFGYRCGDLPGRAESSRKLCRGSLRGTQSSQETIPEQDKGIEVDFLPIIWRNLTAVHPQKVDGALTDSRTADLQYFPAKPCVSTV